MPKRNQNNYIDHDLTAAVRVKLKDRLVYMGNCMARLKYAAEDETKSPYLELADLLTAMEKHIKNTREDIAAAKSIIIEDKKTNGN